MLVPGQSLDMQLRLGVGLEQYSAAYAERVLTETIDRDGLDSVIDQAAVQAHRRTHTTGDIILDRIMNRHLPLNAYFA